MTTLIRSVMCPLLLEIALNVFAPSLCFAELPSPQLHRIEPVGLNAPGEVQLTLLGADIEEVETLLFEHPGFKAEFIKERTFKLSVAADVPVGTWDVRAVGRFGVTNARLFSVTRGLLDVAEVEPNNEPPQAQVIVVNSALNGSSDGNNQDLFRVPLKARQRVVIHCQSARLDTEMDPALTLKSSDGRQLASNGDYEGRDPLIDFLAPAAGEYLIEVRDLTYRGGYPYRLIVTDRPQIENVFPRAVQAGQNVELTVLGRNLGAGSAPSSWLSGELPLDTIKLAVRGSDALLPLGAYRFREHATQHSVLPTAATCTLIGEQITLLEANPQTLLVSETPTSVEVEPNDQREQAQQLTLPAVVSGRFDRERDLDWFAVETDEQGGQYGFEVYCERIAGRADPFLSVTDEKGNPIGMIDDYGHRIGSFDGHLRDPSGSINLQPKTKYRVLVKDTYNRGGARYQYVLSVRKPQPDFFAASIHMSNNMSGLNVWQGGSESIDVVIHACDGFNQPVTVTVEGLPAGLHASPLTINNNNRGTLVLWADDNAAPTVGSFKVFATTVVGDKTLRREVRPFCRVFNLVGSRELREHFVAVRERAPFALSLVPDRVTVESGQKTDVKLKLVRHWSDFKNAVNYQPLNFQGSFQLGNGTIAPDQTEATLSINVQAGTRPGDYTLSVQGQAQVPFHKDEKSTTRPNTLVSVPSQTVTISVTEPVKK